MRPLASLLLAPLILNKRLLAALLFCAVRGEAQTRGGAIETGAGTPGIQTGSLSSPLTPGVVPQLVTLTLSAPSLSPAPGLAAPPLLAPAAPLALPLQPVQAVQPAALQRIQPVALRVAALKGAQSAAYAPSAAEGESAPSLLAPIKALFASEAPEGLEKLDDERLLRMTKDLAGEGGLAESGGFTPVYLRRDKPLPFAPDAARRYVDALGYGVGSASRAKAVVDASEDLLRGAGIGFTRTERINGGKAEESLVIVPDRYGSSLNRLAWDIKSRHGATLEYAPARLGYSAVATFNHELNALFLPHFGRAGTYAAVLHEAHHSNYAKRQLVGDLSPFHAAALAKSGLSIVPRAAHYADYASMEELTGHAKTIKHLLTELRGKKETSWWDAYAVDVEALKLDDLSRSASILSGRILAELKDGAPVLPLPAGHWALSQLGPLQGGTWHSIKLPWCEFFLPVMDEPAPPPRSGLARLFTRAPETPGRKAARRTALALKSWLREAWPALSTLRARLAAEPPDWNELNALADKITSAGRAAEKEFKASR